MSNGNNLRSYDLHELVAVDGDIILPGSMVRHVDHPKSLGTALTRTLPEGALYAVIMVLWTIEPTGLFGSFAFPVVKRVFSPSSLAPSLVSIQPMSLPSGKIFFLDYTYGSGLNGPSVP